MQSENWPVKVEAPAGPQILNPVPVPPMADLSNLTLDWWMEVLEVSQMADTSTPEGAQALALQVFQLATGMRIVLDRLEELETLAGLLELELRKVKHDGG